MCENHKQILRLEAERWRLIDQISGLYEVSSLGRVRRSKTGRVLRQFRNRNGYLMVSLWDGRKKQNAYVHRLVATGFHGINVDDDACHNDGDRSNNSASNIRWAARRENHQDKLRHGTQKYGEDLYNAKLTWDSVALIRKSELSDSVLASRFGVSTSAVHQARNGLTWKNTP